VSVGVNVSLQHQIVLVLAYKNSSP
jgi:hypothetical protein